MGPCCESSCLPSHWSSFRCSSCSLHSSQLCWTFQQNEDVTWRQLGHRPAIISRCRCGLIKGKFPSSVVYDNSSCASVFASDCDLEIHPVCTSINRKRPSDRTALTA